MMTGVDSNVKRRNSNSSSAYVEESSEGKLASRKPIAGQPRLPNGRFQSTKASSSTGDYNHRHHENDRPGGDEMMEYQQQRAWLDHHYRSMYPSASSTTNSRSNSFPSSTANAQQNNNSNNHNASVKFVNATPDSLESQIKREEMGPKKKRMRTTPEQLRILNKEFLTNSMPSSTSRIQLAKRLGMSARAVQVWFQNRRAKAKLDAKRSGQSSPKANSSMHSGGHRRAYSHNALYSYPSGTSYNQIGQQSMGGNYSDGEEALEHHQGFHSEQDSSGIGGALDEYLGGTTGLFLDPSEMILLSPPIDQQKQKHPTPILPGRPAHSAPYQQNHHQIQPPADDPIDHRQRLSPFEPVMLGEDFYGNRANSLPIVSEYGPVDELLPESVMLQDPVIPPPPPLLYYCNAFSTSSSGPAMGGNNASTAFYYQPTPQPMLAPFFNTSNNGNNSMNNTAGVNNNGAIQKRSFSLPCIRPAIPSEGGYYQHPGPRIAEDEELLLGLGTHILEESEYRSNRSHSISEQF